MTHTSTVEALRNFYSSHRTRSVSFRLQQLRAIRNALVQNEQLLSTALAEDLGKSTFDAYTTEIGYLLNEIDYMARRLRAWVRPERRRTPMIAWPATSRLHREPYGVVLVLGPWNYPLQLLLSPLVGALAGGNCVCLKPSELAPATAAAVEELLRDCFPPGLVSVVTGDASTAQALLQERFDHIFFTGSTAIGQKVMAAAAKHLTPVTLELGGKSPCIVCPDAKLDMAARRILWGKCLNAGQTCVAPDYVLVDTKVRDAFVEALRRALDQFFGGRARESKAYGRIVSRRHVDRLAAYLECGTVAIGGEYDGEARFFEPTVLTDVAADTPVMQEEIFGPVLPVLTFESLDEAIAAVRERPAPLALYLFTESRTIRRRVVRETSSGGVCVNDTTTQIVNKELPFGGVGASGMGRYHGRASFDCFTQERAVMRRGTCIDPSYRYPPPRTPLKQLKRVYSFMMGR